MHDPNDPSPQLLGHPGPPAPPSEHWRAVWLGAAILLVLAVLLAAWMIGEEPPGNENEGWAYAFFLTPILAGVSSLVMTIVAAFAVSWPEWRGPYTTARMLVLGVILSCVGALAILSVPGSTNLADGFATIVLPVGLGVACVLVPLWLRFRQGHAEEWRRRRLRGGPGSP